jgi:hypothetical protein
MSLGSPIALLTGIYIGEARGVDSSAYSVTFEKQYEKVYGTAHVPFFHGSFEQVP